jgi:hypothetical protein
MQDGPMVAAVASSCRVHGAPLATQMLTGEEGRRSGAGAHDLPQPELLLQPNQVALPRILEARLRSLVVGMDVKCLLCACQRATQRCVPRFLVCTRCNRESDVLLTTSRSALLFW